uniref:Uncharacterized protein n=1 Tax=Paravannella minima TaxID=1443144 RepID=A0A411K7K9_9EUKA|nr:hypothetical protein [Paravannella minima]QBC73421.1 hypothetical protein [Paravannella minima]
MAVPKKKRSISINRNRNYIKLKNTFKKKLQSINFLEKEKFQTNKYLFNKLFFKFLVKTNNNKKEIDKLFISKLFRIPSFYLTQTLFFNCIKNFDKFIVLYYSYYFKSFKINSYDIILNFDFIFSKKVIGKKIFCQQSYFNFLSLFGSK